MPTRERFRNSENDYGFFTKSIDNLPEMCYTINSYVAILLIGGVNMRKHIFRKLTSILLTGAMLTGLASTLPATAETAPDEYHDDWLHVENAQVVDMYGNPVWMTGCNWFGYNVGSQVFDGVWSRNMHECLNEIADHGFNLLRVPMSVELLLQWKNGDPDPMIKVNEYKNPELTIEGVEGGTPMYSFDIWNKAVEWCRENGIKIMIDIHCAETASAGHQFNLWYTDKFSTEDWLEALEWVADYYKDDDTIIAIDLKNEPHGTADTAPDFAKWDDSTDPNNWKYAAERGAAAVLGANPNLLVMVEGTEVYPKFEEGNDWTSPNIDYSRYPYSYYHHTWWGGNFRGVKDLPLENIGENNSQLVYSPHDYGPLVYNQTWFDKDFTSETLMEDVWYDNWFYLVDQNIAPLLMGEWGGFIDAEHDEDGKNTKWMTYLRDLMIENHIHHTFWCFNENSGDTGGLVYDNFEKWDEEKYALVEPALWQDEDGKFISLDHKIPVGKNGISLSDYYGSSSGTPTPTEPASAGTEPPATEQPASGTASAICGDVDESGDVQMVDMIALNKYLMIGAPLSEQGKRNADVNANGEIEPDDGLNILRYVIELIPSLPV